jgi:hypothetical protein
MIRKRLKAGALPRYGGKVDQWVCDNGLKKTPFYAYLGGKIKGTVGAVARAKIEAAIEATASELGIIASNCDPEQLHHFDAIGTLYWRSIFNSYS